MALPSSNYTFEMCKKTPNGFPGVDYPKPLEKAEGYKIPMMPENALLSCENTTKIFMEREGETSWDCFSEAVKINWEQVLYDNGNPKPRWKFTFSFDGVSGICKCNKLGLWIGGMVTWGSLYNQISSQGAKITIEVTRDNLPCPGEPLFAYLVVPDSTRLSPSFITFDYTSTSCTPSQDRYPSKSISIACLAGERLVYGGRFFFETPTWTGGIIESFYTETTGTVVDANLCPSSFGVESDPTLIYGIKIRNNVEQVKPSDFAGYGNGDFALVRKVGKEYSEPFGDTLINEVITNFRIVPWRYPL